ncbi:Co(2+)/Mg(2+) efflux protein ApaG [Coraliomargarita akajimensis]|uniref:Co(2+)/Mg(2+) efflux protein ApaG n=1 Tax=Coraliomargarita akajimensis TaxID=395922 RepID=UPI0003044454|nr:ApaG domain [Coraliomargarita akajimensis]
MNSTEVPGIRANLDRLVYFFDDSSAVIEAPHAFIYFITITNLSDRTITLNGRRWVLQSSNGEVNVVEGDGIVGKSPTLSPGESFSYNSHHQVSMNASAQGSFHGVDSEGTAIHVRIPSFDMTIPTADSAD